MFPPVVIGTIILVIGISLMRVGINWAGGGLQTFTKIVVGTPAAFPNPAFGQLTGLGIALFVLVVIRCCGGRIREDPAGRAGVLPQPPA